MSWPPGRFPRATQREPLDPPGVAVDAAPTVCIEMSESWRSFVVGCLEHLTYPTAWRGTDVEVEIAVDRVNEIIELFAVGECAPSVGGWTLGSGTDSQLGSTTVLG